METENSEKWAISICGLNCAKCDMYEAGHGNQKLRDEIVEWFKKERNESVKPKKIRCDGCRGPLELHWSSDCEMMSCATKKSFQYCFECGDFPCKILSEFGSDGISHHKRTVENLKRMKRIGLTEWIAEQKKKGQCLFCP
jgi:hypothetical protein